METPEMPKGAMSPLSRDTTNRQISSGAAEVFLAYASPDKLIALQLYDLLTVSASVFIDCRSLRPGDSWDRSLDDALSRALLIVILVSEHTNDAWYQRDEIAAAIARTRRSGSITRIVPVLLSHGGGNWLPYGLRTVQAVTLGSSVTIEDAARIILEILADVRTAKASQILSGTATIEPGSRQAICLIVCAANLPDSVTRAVTGIVESLNMQVLVRRAHHRRDHLGAARRQHEVESALVVIVAGDIDPQLLVRIAASRPVILVKTTPDDGETNTSGNVIVLESEAEAQDLTDELSAALREALLDVLIEIEEIITVIASRTSATGIPIPVDLFDLPLEIRNTQEEVIAEGVISASRDLFDNLFRDDNNRMTVVTGLPGSGKSVLLTRYARWLTSTVASSKPNIIPNLPIVLSPQDLYEISRVSPHGLITTESLWNEIGKLVDRTAPQTSLNLVNLVQAVDSSQRLDLIIDGLDEFGSRNRAALLQLLEAVSKFAASGTRVTLACRSNFWNEQVKDHLPVGRQVVLMPLGPGETRRLLQEVPLPSTARDSKSGEIAEWIRSPLLVRFLRQLRYQANTSILLEAIRSRTSVYRAWSRWVASEARMKGIHPDFSKLCEEVALDFVRLRRFELDAGVVLNHLNYAPGTDGRLTTLAQLDALEVFDRSSAGADVANPAVLASTSMARHEPASVTTEPVSPRKGLRFQHETILEFFAVQALSVDFINALNPSYRYHELAKLRLSQVMLDHFQSSVYGFVDEMLEPGNYRAALVRWLAQVNLEEIPELLGRNLIEYLGLTVRVEDAAAVSQALCEVVCDEHLALLLRYNAARALERSHPAAPHPYYEYVSDWGTTDFTSFSSRQIKESGDGPWVMRGWRAQEAACRRYITFGPNDPSVDVDDDLQLGISARLLGTLESLTVDSVPTDFPLRVNASLALVRWFHTSHYERWVALCRTCRSERIEREVVENLEQWVMRWR